MAGARAARDLDHERRCLERVEVEILDGAAFVTQRDGAAQLRPHQYLVGPGGTGPTADNWMEA